MLYKFSTFQTRFKSQLTSGLYFYGALTVYFLNFFKVASYISGLAPNIEKLTGYLSPLTDIFRITLPCIVRTGSVDFFIDTFLLFLGLDAKVTDLYSISD